VYINGEPEALVSYQRDSTVLKNLLIDTQYRFVSFLCFGYYFHYFSIYHYESSTVGRRAFGYAGPKAWNSLPDYSHIWTIDTDTHDVRFNWMVFCGLLYFTG